MLLPYVQTTATATHDADGDPSNVTRGVCIMTIDVGFPGADDAADAHERPLLRSGPFFYGACLGPPAVGFAASSTAWRRHARDPSEQLYGPWADWSAPLASCPAARELTGAAVLAPRFHDAGIQ